MTLYATFVVAIVVLSLSVGHMAGAIDGHEAELGISSTNGIQALIGFVVAVVSMGLVVAPFVMARKGRRPARNRRR